MKTCFASCLLALTLASPASAQWTTATVQPKSYVKGDVSHLVAILSNGSGKSTRVEMDLPVNESSAAQVTAKLRGLNAVETAKPNVVAPGAVLSLVDVILPPPTQAQLDKAAWLAKLSHYYRLKAAVNGGLTSAQADADALLAELNKDYLAGYVD